VSDTVAALTGSPPLPVRDGLAANRAAFSG
jgi:hypothetical protein